MNTHTKLFLTEVKEAFKKMRWSQRNPDIATMVDTIRAMSKTNQPPKQWIVRRWLMELRAGAAWFILAFIPRSDTAVRTLTANEFKNLIKKDQFRSGEHSVPEYDSYHLHLNDYCSHREATQGAVEEQTTNKKRGRKRKK